MAEMVKRKINLAALKKKKDDFWTTILALCNFRQQKNLPTSTMFSVGVMPKLCNNCPLQINAHIHPKATSATALHLTTFCIKMVRNRQREKKERKKTIKKT